VRPALRAPGQHVRLEPHAIVFYAQDDLAVLTRHRQADALGPGMLSDIGERLAGDPEDLGLDGSRERRAGCLRSRLEADGEL
jgi:hypothetical protein